MTNCRETEYFYPILYLITNFEPMIFSIAYSLQLQLSSFFLEDYKY